MRGFDPADHDQLVAGAMAVWTAMSGVEPREPLDSKGGPLDRGGWCWQVALAVRYGAPLPPVASDQRLFVTDPTVQAAENAMGVVYKPRPITPSPGVAQT
jgi:hypothetical protein